ncbi:MAG: 2-oxo acid dehydrogenase subunit E2 [Chloroflexota bacterium]|nr:2-oxo acid dehydrogenase subunit E2 [Chloroflexota bacterium]
MAEVSMPRLSDTMQEGTITRWLKKPGDEVKKGDIIAEVETDKANMEVESFDAGVLEQILVNEGETAPIGQTIAVLGSGENVQQGGQAKQADGQQGGQPKQASGQQDGQSREADVQPQKPSDNGKSEKAPTAAEDPTGANPSAVVESTLASDKTAQTQDAEAQSTSSDSGVKASPLARRIAEEHGINIGQVKGSGPGGRIVRDDVEEFLEQQRNQPAQAAQTSQPAAQQPAAQQTPAAPSAQQQGDEVRNMSSMQKTVARRLTESKQTVPHFYVSNEIDLTDALALRQQLNSNVGEGGVKISVNDLVVKACALALEKFPDVNSSYKDGQFIHHQRINVGIAVDIPNGLIVPVIRDANIKGVRSIAREAKALAEKARVGKLAPDDFSGGTFSVSNLGMMDVTEFVPVINPPEAAILAVASARKTFVPINGEPVVRDIMPLTVSADHRILYGAMVARFLQEVKRLLQNPYDLLG